MLVVTWVADRLKTEDLYSHGIFAAGGAYVPTQEKKHLRILENWEIANLGEDRA